MAEEYPHPYRPWRQYAEKNGWTYPDTSSYIRWYLRAKFMRGQQLWDDDINNNSEMINWWNPRWSHRRRDLNPPKHAPIHLVSTIVDVMDPAQYAGLPAGLEDVVYFQTPSYAYDLLPMPGFSSYVIADKMTVMYDGAAWRPLWRLAEKNRNYELAFFHNSPKGGEVLFRHVITQRFKVPVRNGSRIRGLGTLATLRIMKNGVHVLNGIESLYSSVVQPVPGPQADVIFEVGDILTVDTPPGASGMSALALSLVGGLA